MALCAVIMATQYKVVIVWALRYLAEFFRQDLPWADCRQEGIKNDLRKVPFEFILQQQISRLFRREGKRNVRTRRSLCPYEGQMPTEEPWCGFDFPQFLLHEQIVRGELDGGQIV